MGCSNILETSLCKSLVSSLVSRKPCGRSHFSSVFRKQGPILQARVSLPGSCSRGREDIFDTKLSYYAYSFFFLSFFLHSFFLAFYPLTVGIESHSCTGSPKYLTRARQDSYGRRIGPSWRPPLHNTHHSQETDIHTAAGLEPAIPTSERPYINALGRGYIGARNDTTQHSGQTPDKEVESSKLLFISAATLKPIRLECYLPRLFGANKVSLFRANSLARYLLQCA